MPERSDPVADLIQFLTLHWETGLDPIIWVGAGASAAAGYPTLDRLAKILRQRLPDAGGKSYQLVDAFVDEYSESTLAALLQKHRC